MFGDKILAKININEHILPIFLINFILYWQIQYITKNLKTSIFVSPELSSVRDYVITHSVRSM